MTTSELRDVYRKLPFQPFILHLADGRQIKVAHPDWVTLSPGGRIVRLTNRDGSVSRIDLLLVTELQVVSTGEAVLGV